MKYISILASLLIVLIISSCGAKEERTENLDNNNNVVEATLDTTQDYSSYEEFVSDGAADEEVNPVDSSSKEMVYVDQTKEIQIDPPVEEKKVIEEKPVVKKEETKVHEQRFYIVVGSFKEYGNAQKLFDYFKKKGYYPLILPKVNEYNRVAISSYVEETNARKAIKKLRVEHNDLTFWIYKW